MRITQKPQERFEPITIVLETKLEAKRLMQLTGDFMYNYLLKEYGDELHLIISFKRELQEKLSSLIGYPIFPHRKIKDDC